MPKRGGVFEAILAARVREMRTRQGLTQQDLSERVHALGGALDRVAIIKIENGNRGVALDEVLLLAAALQVAPVQLMSPHARSAKVTLGNVTVSGNRLRRWIRGRKPLRDSDDRSIFFGFVSQTDWDVYLTPLHFIDDAVGEVIDSYINKDADKAAAALRQLIKSATQLLWEIEGEPPVLEAERERLREERLRRVGMPHPPRFRHREWWVDDPPEEEEEGD